MPIVVSDKGENCLDKRIFYFDRLRIISAIAVIVIHICGIELFKHSTASPAWNMYNILDSFSRFAVPMFIMLSGALFLNPEKQISLKSLYAKKILRIVTAFVFWSFFYSLVNELTDYNGDMSVFVKGFILGHHHMYFLYVIAGLYLAVPIFREICGKESLSRYFLILALVFTFVVPFLSKLPHMSIIADIEQKMSFRVAVGYSAYFVGGYYLSRADIPKKGRALIYVLGAAAFIMTAVLTKKFSEQSQRLYDGFYNGFSINVMLEAVSLFVFARYNLSAAPKSERRAKVISLFSKLTFGIYLVHMFVIDLIDASGIIDNVSNTSLYAVIKFVLVFFVSAVISYVINKIPVLKKYIV